MRIKYCCLLRCSFMEQPKIDYSLRKLASVQVVEAIVPHPNANALQLAKVLGWQVVIRMDEVKAGDKIVYCEIDSLLPGSAEWLPEAIKKRVAEQTSKEWFRIKTIKLRGELSQGLIVGGLALQLGVIFNNCLFTSFVKIIQHM